MKEIDVYNGQRGEKNLKLMIRLIHYLLRVDLVQ